MGFDLAAWCAQYGLLGVALSAFTSATVLPGTSEAAVLAVRALHPQGVALLLMVASVANTAGSMTSYMLGRCIPPRRPHSARAIAWLNRFGPAAMLLCWVPLAGDAIPVAAGWMRLPVLPSTLFCAAGKFLRYALILGLFEVFA
ncbi:MAG TPA: DedA family protein [Sutterella sp.]|nr:DedA family protein [Sutterella sp.]